MVRTTFLKIDRDTRPHLQPEGTFPYALNAVKDTESGYSGGLTNELKRIARTKIPGKTVGYHRVEERNSTLFFHIDGGSCLSLWNHDTKTLTPVVKDTEFGCDWGFKPNHWIGFGHSISKTLAPCNDLIVYWSSNLYYFKANIDELLDPERRKSISQLVEPCEHFKWIKAISGPIVKIKPNRGGGLDLPPGQYYTVARFLDESGNTSNWTAIEGPAYIGSKYNKSTDKSRQSLQIEVKNLAKQYSRIEIAVIPPIGSQAQDVAYVIYDGSYNTNGVTAQYYSSSQHKKIISFAEIFGKDIKFIRGDNVFQSDGKAHLYRTVQEFGPKVQKWAKQTEVSIIAFAVPASKAHLFKSLPRNEVIALGQQHKYVDSFYTAVAHLAGPEGAANDLNCGCDTQPKGQTANNASLIEEYVKFSAEKDTFCLIGGQQTTLNEGYTPIQACEEEAIEPRSSEENDCVEHETDSEAVQTEIDGLQTTPEGMVDCIDCNQAEIGNDLKKEANFLTRFLEHTTDLFRTDKQVATDCTTNKFTTPIQAAKDLYNKAVKDADKQEEIKYRTVVSKKTKGKNLERAEVSTKRFFGTTDDCLTDVEPIVLSRWKPGGYESSRLYPKTLDCDGQPLYGDLAGLPIRHFKTPSTEQIPLFITAQSGVESRFDPSNIPGGKDTYVVMLGLQVDNVYIPSYDAGEIPKPLDENEPFRIVMVERERHLQTKVFAGYVTPTFKGKQGNREYAVPRHGVSAYPNVDRSIDNDGSHLGEDWDVPIYMLHSPDVHNANEFVNFDYIKVEGILRGDGMIYGHYVKGKEVKEEDNRKDRRGVRGALNLSDFTPTQFKTCVKGSEFVEFNTNLQNPEGIDYPILNKFRESAIAFQTVDPLPDLGNGNKDWSFNVGGLDHEYPTTGVGWYVTAYRTNTQLYGDVESLQYMDIGLIARKGQTSVRGLVGDTFVQKWSHKRTSFISDKVGNSLNTDYPQTASDDFLGPDTAGGGKDRSVCDPPNRFGMRMKEWLGFYYPQELPENGDMKDPKNMANGHPTLFANEIQGILLEAETDIFFARTYVQLNHLTVESDVNLYFRSTNIPETREVFYEELQGLDVDPSINKVDPEDAWLSDWHNEQLQPSKKQKEKKARIRFLVAIVFPMFLMGLFGTASTAMEMGNTAIFGGGGMLIMYLVLVRNILSGKKLDKLLGIPECKTDDEGAQDENNTRGLKDNWNDYNWGFSAVNDLNFFIGMPANYNTCICTKLSNVIRSSNTQIHTSPHDAYDNFQGLSYTGIPAESGLLQLMVQWENGVYAQTTDGILPLQHKNPAIPTSVGAQVLGSSAWFENPSKIGEGIFEGFGGTSDPNGGIICKAGYVSQDYESKDITIFDGKFNSIVTKGSGLRNYWKNNFEFCNSGDRDQLTSDGIHYTFGYDPRHERLLITKKDGTGGMTWSYDLLTRSYISEHSYVPDFYFWDRNAMFSVEDGQIYEHNVLGEYETPFIVDANVRLGKETPGGRFTYVSSVLDTEVIHLNKSKIPDLYDRPETFEHVSTRNAYQQTGRLEIVPEDQNDARGSIQNNNVVKVSRRDSGKWQFDNIRSNEADRDENIILHQDCGKVEEFNEDNLTLSDTAQKTKQFIGRFLHQRFEFNKSDRQIIIYSLDTYTKDEKL